MNLINSLISLIKKKDEHSKEDVPEGLCPNCWGREEYGGQFFEAVKNNNVDINSKSPNLGWIQDYANKHLSSIALKEQNGKTICQKCKVTYVPSE